MSSDCEHLDFAASVEVNRLSKDEGSPINAYAAEIRIECAHCRERFVFMGLDPGMMPTGPMRSVDGTTALMPIRPLSAGEAFGLGVPGFRVMGGRA